MVFSVKPLRILAALAPYTAALALAMGLKVHFSRAAVDDLLWIIIPTAELVTRLTGMAFVHDPSLGFVNTGHGIAIAPACSGVNFMIIAFGMAFFSFAKRFISLPGKFAWLGGSLAGAYLLTLGVNSLRIGLSIVTITHGVQTEWLTQGRVHRLEGILLYFLFLCLFYRGLNHLIPVHGRTREGVARIEFRALWPLFWYLAMALGAPLFTRNFRNHPRLFWEHALTVLIICTGMVVIFSGFRRICRSKGREKNAQNQATVMQFRPDAFDR